MYIFVMMPVIVYLGIFIWCWESRQQCWRETLELLQSMETMLSKLLTSNQLSIMDFLQVLAKCRVCMLTNSVQCSWQLEHRNSNCCAKRLPLDNSLLKHLGICLTWRFGHMRLWLTKSYNVYVISKCVCVEFAYIAIILFIRWLGGLLVERRTSVS